MIDKTAKNIAAYIQSFKDRYAIFFSEEFIELIKSKIDYLIEIEKGNIANPEKRPKPLPYRYIARGIEKLKLGSRINIVYKEDQERDPDRGLILIYMSKDYIVVRSRSKKLSLIAVKTSRIKSLFLAEETSPQIVTGDEYEKAHQLVEAQRVLQEADSTL